MASTTGCRKSPMRTSVPGAATTSPPYSSPINVMNRPIPAAMLHFKELGIEFTICARRPVKVMAIKKIPASNTAASACCQVRPNPRGTAPQSV